MSVPSDIEIAKAAKAESVFNALFAYRKREARTPKEDYLTAAFAYALRASPEDVARRWVAHVADVDSARIAGRVDVKTQVSYDTPGGRKLVDMVLECDLSGGERLTVLSEHKWDSPTNTSQLEAYRGIATSKPNGKLVFIAPTVKQVTDATQFCKSACLWEEAYKELARLAEEGSVLSQFTEFLMSAGLGPHEPLTLSALAAYAHSLGVDEACYRIAELLDQKDWSFLPKRFDNRAIHSDRSGDALWGRLGLSFSDDEWTPCLFVGFLLDPSNHCLEFCEKRKGVDLMLAIDANPKTRIAGTTARTQAEKMDTMFPAALVQEGEELRNNRWRKLVVRQSLADIVKDNAKEQEQTEAIYAKLKKWCEALFEDGTLETAFSETEWI